MTRSRFHTKYLTTGIRDKLSQYLFIIIISFTFKSGKRPHAIEQHGANIKSFLGDTLEYGVFSGTQYVIPQKRLFTGIVGSQIRKDWLDALGLPVPSTKEEFVSTLQAFKDNDPAGDGRTIPWGMSADLMTQGFYSLHYTFKQEMSEEDFYTVNPWEQPGYKDGLEWVNSIFSQGLISPEFALDKDSSQLKAAISNGQVGFYLSNVGQYHHASSPVIASLLENVPEAEYVPCYPFENAEGKYPKLMYYPYGHYLMVPAASQVVDEAVMFLDWMSQSEVLFTLTSGFEGENYEMKDGVPVDLPYEGEKKLSSDHNNDYVITLNGRDIGDYEQNLDLRAMGHAPHEQFFKDSYAMAATDGVLDPWSFTGFQEPVQSEAKYGTTLNEKRNEMFVRLYMCTPGEFSGLYDSLVEEYMEIGGREVAAERKEVYQRTMG